MKKVFIVIPAYNEEKKLGKVIKNLKQANYKNIVVVDDGSNDTTANVANKAGVFVLRHIINRGQGAALKTGINFALKKGADIIITFDADGQHTPKDISKLIEPIVKGKADIVLGSRFLSEKSNTPFIRTLFLKGGALIFRLLYGVKLTDSHNGLRAMSKKAASSIDISCDDMAHASEIIEEISRHKLRYVEVPVTIKYSDYSLSKGQSSLNSFRILWKMFINKLFK